ncbi:MAG: hypothetical protein KKD56_07280 [Acidobacteria bacterium]|nr:hypothetical protein [Acidobacteriota bacterium]MCG2815097.1 hypothetical protein [Candidatus Aminicenantes bacterium]MBU1338851.1 hypothetical protein [Acidobacteriota bacterium]MBU1473526.1 hypothetical protein [Acidobacteriota bacterium]MBU2437597.1 hypothetical protein [Acidobacteriota bacterium]
MIDQFTWAAVSLKTGPGRTCVTVGRHSFTAFRHAAGEEFWHGTCKGVFDEM